MKKTALIVAVVAVIILAGLSAWYLQNKNEGNKNVNNANAVAVNTNVNQGANLNNAANSNSVIINTSDLENINIESDLSDEASAEKDLAAPDFDLNVSL